MDLLNAIKNKYYSDLNNDYGVVTGVVAGVRSKSADLTQTGSALAFGADNSKGRNFSDETSREYISQREIDSFKRTFTVAQKNINKATGSRAHEDISDDTARLALNVIKTSAEVMATETLNRFGGSIDKSQITELKAVMAAGKSIFRSMTSDESTFKLVLDRLSNIDKTGKTKVFRLMPDHINEAFFKNNNINVTNDDIVRKSLSRFYLNDRTEVDTGVSGIDLGSSTGAFMSTMFKGEIAHDILVAGSSLIGLELNRKERAFDENMSEMVGDKEKILSKSMQNVAQVANATATISEQIGLAYLSGGASLLYTPVVTGTLNRINSSGDYNRDLTNGFDSWTTEANINVGTKLIVGGIADYYMARATLGIGNILISRLGGVAAQRGVTKAILNYATNPSANQGKRRLVAYGLGLPAANVLSDMVMEFVGYSAIEGIEKGVNVLEDYDVLSEADKAAYLTLFDFAKLGSGPRTWQGNILNKIKDEGDKVDYDQGMGAMDISGFALRRFMYSVGTPAYQRLFFNTGAESFGRGKWFKNIEDQYKLTGNEDMISRMNTSQYKKFKSLSKAVMYFYPSSIDDVDKYIKTNPTLNMPNGLLDLSKAAKSRLGNDHIIDDVLFTSLAFETELLTNVATRGWLQEYQYNQVKGKYNAQEGIEYTPTRREKINAALIGKLGNALSFDARQILQGNTFGTRIGYDEAKEEYYATDSRNKIFNILDSAPTITLDTKEKADTFAEIMSNYVNEIKDLPDKSKRLNTVYRFIKQFISKNSLIDNPDVIREVAFKIRSSMSDKDASNSEATKNYITKKEELVPLSLDEIKNVDEFILSKLEERSNNGVVEGNDFYTYNNIDSETLKDISAFIDMSHLFKDVSNGNINIIGKNGENKTFEQMSFEEKNKIVKERLLSYSLDGLSGDNTKTRAAVIVDLAANMKKIRDKEGDAGLRDLSSLKSVMHKAAVEMTENYIKKLKNYSLMAKRGQITNEEFYSIGQKLVVSIQLLAPFTKKKEVVTSYINLLKDKEFSSLFNQLFKRIKDEAMVEDDIVEFVTNSQLRRVEREDYVSNYIADSILFKTEAVDSAIKRLIETRGQGLSTKQKQVINALSDNTDESLISGRVTVDGKNIITTGQNTMAAITRLSDYANSDDSENPLEKYDSTDIVEGFSLSLRKRADILLAEGYSTEEVVSFIKTEVDKMTDSGINVVVSKNTDDVMLEVKIVGDGKQNLSLNSNQKLMLVSATIVNESSRMSGSAYISQLSKSTGVSSAIDQIWELNPDELFEYKGKKGVAYDSIKTDLEKSIFGLSDIIRGYIAAYGDFTTAREEFINYLKQYPKIYSSLGFYDSTTADNKSSSANNFITKYMLSKMKEDGVVNNIKAILTSGDESSRLSITEASTFRDMVTNIFDTDQMTSINLSINEKDETKINVIKGKLSKVGFFLFPTGSTMDEQTFVIFKNFTPSSDELTKIKGAKDAFLSMLRPYVSIYDNYDKKTKTYNKNNGNDDPYLGIKALDYNYMLYKELEKMTTYEPNFTEFLGNVIKKMTDVSNEINSKVKYLSNEKEDAGKKIKIQKLDEKLLANYNDISDDQADSVIRNVAKSNPEYSVVSDDFIQSISDYWKSMDKTSSIVHRLFDFASNAYASYADPINKEHSKAHIEYIKNITDELSSQSISEYNKAMLAVNKALEENFNRPFDLEVLINTTIANKDKYGLTTEQVDGLNVMLKKVKDDQLLSVSDYSSVMDFKKEGDVKLTKDTYKNNPNAMFAGILYNIVTNGSLVKNMGYKISKRFNAGAVGVSSCIEYADAIVDKFLDSAAMKDTKGNRKPVKIRVVANDTDGQEGPSVDDGTIYASRNIFNATTKILTLSGTSSRKVSLNTSGAIIKAVLAENTLLGTDDGETMIIPLSNIKVFSPALLALLKNVKNVIKSTDSKGKDVFSVPTLKIDTQIKGTSTNVVNGVDHFAIDSDVNIGDDYLRLLFRSMALHQAITSDLIEHAPSRQIPNLYANFGMTTMMPPSTRSSLSAKLTQALGEVSSGETSPAEVKNRMASALRQARQGVSYYGVLYDLKTDEIVARQNKGLGFSLLGLDPVTKKYDDRIFTKAGKTVIVNGKRTESRLTAHFSVNVKTLLRELQSDYVKNNIKDKDTYDAVVKEVSEAIHEKVNSVDYAKVNGSNLKNSNGLLTPDDLKKYTYQMLDLLASTGAYAKIREAKYDDKGKMIQTPIYGRIADRFSNDGYRHDMMLILSEVTNLTEKDGISMNSEAADCNLADFDGDTATFENTNITNQIRIIKEWYGISSIKEEDYLDYIGSYQKDLHALDKSIIVSNKWTDEDDTLPDISFNAASSGGQFMKVIELVQNSVASFAGLPNRLLFPSYDDQIKLSSPYFEDFDKADRTKEYDSVTLKVTGQKFSLKNLMSKTVFFRQAEGDMLNARMQASAQILGTVSLGKHKDLDKHEVWLQSVRIGDKFFLNLLVGDNAGAGVLVKKSWLVSGASGDDLDSFGREKLINIFDIHKGSFKNQGFDSFGAIVDKVMTENMLQVTNTELFDGLRCCSIMEFTHQASNSFTNNNTTNFSKHINKLMKNPEFLYNNLTRFVSSLAAAALIDYNSVKIANTEDFLVQNLIDRNSITEEEGLSRAVQSLTSAGFMDEQYKALIEAQMSIRDESTPSSIALLNRGRASFKAASFNLLSKVTDTISERIRMFKIVENMIKGNDFTKEEADMAYNTFKSIKDEYLNPEIQQFVIYGDWRKHKSSSTIIGTLLPESYKRLFKNNELEEYFESRNDGWFIFNTEVTKTLSNIHRSAAFMNLILEAMPITDTNNEMNYAKRLFKQHIMVTNKDMINAKDIDDISQKLFALINDNTIIPKNQRTSVSTKAIKDFLVRNHINLSPEIHKISELNIATVGMDKKAKFSSFTKMNKISTDVFSGNGRKLLINGHVADAEMLTNIFRSEVKKSNGHADIQLLQNIHAALLDVVTDNNRVTMMMQSQGLNSKTLGMLHEAVVVDKGVWHFRNLDFLTRTDTYDINDDMNFVHAKVREIYVRSGSLRGLDNGTC